MPAVKAPRVTVIPAKKDQLPINVLSGEAIKRLPVAAYARVSTNYEEQLTSYEAQVDYYFRYIQSKEEWEFVAVYTDEGISATNTKNAKALTAWWPTRWPEKSTLSLLSRSAALPVIQWIP